jgi:hypothetical protein
MHIEGKTAQRFNTTLRLTTLTTKQDDHVKTTFKNLMTIALSALFVLTLAACSDGPAEDAGEEFDKVVEDAGNAVEDACEETKEALDAKDKDC